MLVYGTRKLVGTVRSPVPIIVNTVGRPVSSAKVKNTVDVHHLVADVRIAGIIIVRRVIRLKNFHDFNRKFQI